MEAPPITDSAPLDLDEDSSEPYWEDITEEEYNAWLEEHKDHKGPVGPPPKPNRADKRRRVKTGIVEIGRDSAGDAVAWRATKRAPWDKRSDRRTKNKVARRARKANR